MDLKEKQTKRKPTKVQEEIIYRVQRNLKKFNEELLAKGTLLVKNLVTNKEFEVHYYNKTVIIFQDNEYEGTHDYGKFLALLATTMYGNIEKIQHSGYTWK